MTTLQTYFVGNSVTDTINYNGFVDLAATKGHTQIWGRHMIPGAPLSWIWQHPNDGFREEPYGFYPNALNNYSWDVLSLQPFDRPIGGPEGDLTMVGNFVDLAKLQNPDLRVYLYQRWPGQRNYTLDAPTWNSLWLRSYDDQVNWMNMESRDFFSDLVKQVNRAAYMQDLDPALIVPVGDVLYTLNNRLSAGYIAGYNDVWDLYSDPSHLNNLGSYTVATTFYARLFNDSPIGLGVPAAYGSISPEWVSLIQQSVWEVVRNFNPNNLNPVAIHNQVTTAQGVAASISIASLLANDLDGDGGSLTVQANLTTNPANGTLSRAANGDYVYRPNAGFVGSDQFQYSISDGQGGSSSASVKITVNPQIKGTSAADTLIGTANNDSILGLGGNDKLFGRDGNDLLNGSNGNDQLDGENGNDILIGGSGSDRMTGGTGSDRFALYHKAAANNGIDTLTDFGAGLDRISVSKTQFGLSQAPGTLLANAFTLGASATQASHRFLYESTSGTLYFDADGSGGLAPVSIAQLSNLPALTRSDILVTA